MARRKRPQHRPDEPGYPSRTEHRLARRGMLALLGGAAAVGTPSPTVCQLEQRIIRTADRMAATLYGENNPAFLKKFYP